MLEGFDVPHDSRVHLFDSNSCSLQGPSAMRMRAPMSTGLNAIVASAWLAVLLGSASLAACEDAGGVPVVLLLRHGDLALFFFHPVPLLHSRTDVLRRSSLDCFCWIFL